MATAASLSHPNKSLFSILKQNLRKKVLEDKQLKVTHTADTENASQEVQKCKKCGWVGKDADTKKKYLLFADTLETEHFCPKCNGYIGFKCHKNQ